MNRVLSSGLSVPRFLMQDRSGPGGKEDGSVRSGRCNERVERKGRNASSKRFANQSEAQKRLKRLKTQEKLEKRLLRSSRDRRLSCPPRCRSLRYERAVEAMAAAEVMASMAARHPCHLWKTSISLFLRQRTAAVRDGSPSLYLTRWTAAVKIWQQKCQTTTTQAWRNAEEVEKSSAG